jgi:L-cysteine/cystine lyase
MARLTQIIDKSQIISLQKRLTNVLGMSVVFEEPDGGLLNVIGQRGGVCKACTDFIDLEETGRKKCLYSDSDAASKAQSGLLTRPSFGNIVVEFYVCNGRLRNFVIPISIGGEVIGNVFSGQFLVKTLASWDPAFDTMLAMMQELGVTRDEALRYASMLEEEEILQIARDNNIPIEHLSAFQAAYKEVLENAKPLSYVIEAVYLLNEIAQTLSALGNAYYYNDTYAKLTALVHDELRPILADKLEELGGLVRMIRAKPNVDLSTEITNANRLIHELLSNLEIHESAYIRELFSPYGEGLIPVTPQISELQRRLLIARSMYDTKKARTILNKALRDKTVSPGMYSSEDRKLFDGFDLRLKEVEDVLSEEPTIVLEHIDREAGTLQPKVIMEIKDKFTRREPRVVEQKIGLDDIEDLVFLLGNADFGLKRIRNGLCGERVLNGLPTPLAEFRRKLRLGYDIVCLNWGGISSSSNSVIRELNLWSSEIDRHGPVSVFSEKRLESPVASENVLSSVRGTVASLIRCKTDEVVLTHNTTHGIALALSSVDFSPKGGRGSDRILLTNCEHDTVFHCIEQIERKFNVKHETLNLLGGPSASTIIDNIVSKSSDGRTKVVILSHVTFNTGQVLDIANIVQGVRKILTDKSLLFLVDGAQAVGHVPVDVSALDCDFYAADAHKWLMGPRGSGFLYVDESYLEKRSDYFGFYESYMVAGRYRPRREERGRIYEPATMSVETYIGMRTAIEAVLDAYRRFPAVYERILSLSQMFRRLTESILGSYGVQLINHECKSGLVAVSFSGHDDFELYDEVRKNLDQRFHILVRALDNPPCLRFSIGYLNSEWEINFTVKAMEKILEEIPTLAKTKARIDQEQEILQLRRNRISQIIKTIFVEAKDALSTRYRESERRFSDIKLIRRSRRIYEETEAELDDKMQEFLRRAESSGTAEELEALESMAEKETNRITYGK